MLKIPPLLCIQGLPRNWFWPDEVVGISVRFCIIIIRIFTVDKPYSAWTKLQDPIFTRANTPNIVKSAIELSDGSTAAWNLPWCGIKKNLGPAKEWDTNLYPTRGDNPILKTLPETILPPPLNERCNTSNHNARYLKMFNLWCVYRCLDALRRVVKPGLPVFCLDRD